MKTSVNEREWRTGEEIIAGQEEKYEKGKED